MLAAIIWEQKKTVIYTIIAGTVGGLTAVSLFAQSGFLISKAALMPPFYTILILAAFLKLFGVAKSTSKYAERLLSHKVTFHIMSRVRESYFAKLLQQTSIFNKYKSGDLLERITSDVETLQHTFLRVTYPPLVAGAVFIATILFTLIFSWQIAVLLMIGYCIVAFLIPFAFAKWMTIDHQQNRLQLTTSVTDYLYGYETYKHYNLLSAKNEDVLAASEKYERQQMQLEKQLSIAHTMNHFVALAIAIFVLLAGASAVSEGTLQGVYLAMLLMVTLTVFDLATPLANSPYYVAATNEAVTRLQHITEQQTGTLWVERATPIAFHQLSFQYDEAILPVLQNVTLSIQEGEKVAIIGESGSGKSTFMHLLLKELQPTTGTITLNDVELNQIDDASLFGHFAVQLQHNHFFVGTVRDNLMLVNEYLTDEQMLAALNYVELSCTLDDDIEEKALNFSGGERQRLAFARLLLMQAPVMLLDEPFSSIDVRLKEKFMKDLCGSPSTVVMITHDTECLQYFDSVYEVSGGSVLKVM